jgi:hypothetical protein
MGSEGGASRASGTFFLGIDLFSADGNFTHKVDEALPPIPAIQAVGTKRSSGFGRWKRTGTERSS